MRTAITIGRKAGDKTWTILAGPDVPIHEQLAAIKPFKRTGKHPDLDEIQLYEEHSRAQTLRLLTPKAEAEAKAKADAAEKAAKAKAEAEAKAKAAEQPEAKTPKAEPETKILKHPPQPTHHYLSHKK